ncbi:MAG: hypothetical protein QGH37_25435 [Candidatus Poribacteria bacterium]|jgi:hypothetical protein|nr:hypothetical protein [Candidatus Poribacteria bacterium]
MDDADGRRRGLRATPSLALFQALSDHYGITITKKLLIAVGCPISICLAVMPTEDMYSESIDLMSQFSARRYPAQDVPQHS